MDDPPDDYLALAARVMRPEHPRLMACLQIITGASEEECRQALETGASNPLRRIAAFYSQYRETPWAGLTTPREIWEAIAPMDWIGDERRRFELPDGTLGDAPPTVRAALTLAADPQGVLTAEALAREALHRLRGWGLPEPRNIAWRAVHPESFRSTFCVGTRAEPDPINALVAWALKNGVLAASSLQRAREPESRTQGDHAAARMRDALRLRTGGCSPGNAWDVGVIACGDVCCRHLGAGNPFAPLLALWGTGYGFDRLGPEALVLVAPLR